MTHVVLEKLKIKSSSFCIILTIQESRKGEKFTEFLVEMTRWLIDFMLDPIYPVWEGACVSCLALGNLDKFINL